MEQQRIFLLLLLGMISFMIYTTWESEHAPQAVQNQTSSTTASQASNTSTATGEQNTTLPNSASGGDDFVMPAPKSTAATTETESTAQVSATPEASKGKIISIETDLVRMHVDTQGGKIVQVDLLHYPVSVEDQETPFRLFDQSQQRYLTAQQGFNLSSKQAELGALTPNSKTVFNSAQDSYVLDGNSLRVDLTWTNKIGITFIERLEFSKGSYAIDVKHIIQNNSQRTWRGHTYARLERSKAEKKSGLGMLPTYTGPVFYSPDEKYDKVSFGDIDDVAEKISAQQAKNGAIADDINRSFAGGWIAMIEHYFAGAFVPPKEDVYSYFTHKKTNGHYMIGMMSAEKTVPPQQSLETDLKLYIGPKIQKDLEQIAPGLELSVDFGWLTFISKPLFWLLDKIHGFVGNWGWSIILLTILIKLVFYKLSETSYKSMARMKKLAPRMKQINDRYADDRQRKGQAIMEMYKKEKVNPMGGCLPILIQIPVFIALYYVLLESVELRQAPWIFWLNDLSIKDPYYVLPLLMGASMFFQQRLNPPPPDPMQAKMMMMLPFVFTFLFLFFPSGLVLYWVVNNVLSIAQQWYITRIVMAEKGTRKT